MQLPRGDVCDESNCFTDGSSSKGQTEVGVYTITGQTTKYFALSTYATLFQARNGWEFQGSQTLEVFEILTTLETLAQYVSCGFWDMLLSQEMKRRID